MYTTKNDDIGVGTHYRVQLLFKGTGEPLAWWLVRDELARFIDLEAQAQPTNQEVLPEQTGRYGGFIVESLDDSSGGYSRSQIYGGFIVVEDRYLSAPQLRIDVDRRLEQFLLAGARSHLATKLYAQVLKEANLGP